MHDNRLAAGRLILGRLPGLTLDDQHRQALAEGRLGGVTLFKENAQDLLQLWQLCQDIIKTSRHAPVLTVDQEGGAVQRFDHVLSPLPSPMALAMTRDAQTIENVSSVNAGQLKALGFNLLLAPTLDLLSNARNPIICTRALGLDIDTIVKTAKSMVSGFAKQGILSCGKHFPGHGSTSQDSHLELAVVQKDLEQLISSDLVPFAKMIDEAKLDAMLIGHIWLPLIFKDQNPLPSSMEARIVSDLLIDKLGFKGLIVSDDMTMKAITNAYGLGEACVRAFLAGIDLILVCGTYQQSLEAVEAIAAAIDSGRISQDRLHKSLAKLDLYFADRPQMQSIEAISSRLVGDNALCKQASMQAQQWQWIKYPDHEDRPWHIFRPEHPRYPMRLAHHLNGLETTYPLDPDSEEIRRTIENIQRIALDHNILVLTFRAQVFAGQTNLLKALRNLQKIDTCIGHVQTDTPFDRQAYDQASRSSDANPNSDSKLFPAFTVDTFDPSDLAMQALAQSLQNRVHKGHDR